MEFNLLPYIANRSGLVVLKNIFYVEIMKHEIIKDRGFKEDKTFMFLSEIIQVLTGIFLFSREFYKKFIS